MSDIVDQLNERVRKSIGGTRLDSLSIYEIETLRNDFNIIVNERNELKAELATLKQAQGEPIGFANYQHLQMLNNEGYPATLHKKANAMFSIPIYTSVPTIKPAQAPGTAYPYYVCGEAEAKPGKPA